MNANEIAEKILAERIGNIMIENAKLSGMLAATNTEMASLKAGLASQEKAELKTNAELQEDNNSYPTTASTHGIF